MSRRAVLLIILSIILVFSFFFHRTQQEKEGLKQDFRDSIRVLNSKIEGYYIKNSNLIQAFDSVEVVNTHLKIKRESIKSDWTNAKDEAKKICDTLVINRLDSIYVASEVVCDSLLNNKDFQIDNLQQVISNDSSIISLKDSVISLQENVILDFEDSEKKLKRRNLFLKIGSGALVVLTVIALI